MKNFSVKSFIFGFVVALAIIGLVFLIVNLSNNSNLDGTWRFAGQGYTVTFSGNNFETTGSYNHFRRGSGTFSIKGNSIEFNYDNGGRDVVSFSRNGNTITLSDVVFVRID